MPFGCHSVSNSFLSLPPGNSFVYYFILVTEKDSHPQSAVVQAGNQRTQVTEWLPWRKR